MNDERPTPTKPPLGCTPRWQMDEVRFCELSRAILRFVHHSQRYPAEWATELSEICLRMAEKAKSRTT